MDFSQLPKMSKTPTPPPPPAEADPTLTPLPTSSARQQPHYAAAPYGYDRAPASALVSIWVSLVVGLICLMLGWNFAHWLGGRLSGHPFQTGIIWSEGTPNAGQPVGYFDLQGGTAWTETGFFSMGVALLLDAALIFVASRQATPNRGLIAVALFCTAVTLLLNLGVAGYMLKIGITPLSSMILVLVGGFVLFDQLPLLRRSER